MNLKKERNIFYSFLQLFTLDNVFCDERVFQIEELKEGESGNFYIYGFL